MTKTKTVQEQTIHGSIEYDVVECASCEQEFRLENMKVMYTGQVTEETNYNTFDTVKFNGNSMTKVHFCDGCYEDPIQVNIPFTVPFTTSQMLFYGLLAMWLVLIFVSGIL